jgi:hypothetical protein
MEGIDALAIARWAATAAAFGRGNGLLKIHNYFAIPKFIFKKSGDLRILESEEICFLNF